MADLQIELCGDFRVTVGARTIPDERWIAAAAVACLVAVSVIAWVAQGA